MSVSGAAQAALSLRFKIIQSNLKVPSTNMHWVPDGHGIKSCYVKAILPAGGVLEMLLAGIPITPPAGKGLHISGAETFLLEHRA
ncbi:Immunoglobulin Heavy Variable 3-13 [Manis pentadactyla]|nr:Immunoglobulin Heavy Variable 3-13 [Manis pentadactyla]